MLQIPKAQLVLPQIHCMPATVVTNLGGVTVTASGSTNTKGSWAELFAAASVTYDVYGITLIISNDHTSGANTKNLYDIGVGASGSEVVKVPNIMGSGNTSAIVTMPAQVYLPIFIPKNTRISVRKQSNTASKTGSVAMILHGGGGVAPWPTFAGCDAYGIDTSTSGGLGHGPGNTVYSSWTNIGSTLSRDYGAIFPMFGINNLAMISAANYLQMGIASVAMGIYVFYTSSSEYIPNMAPSIPLYHRWKSGSQLMIRAMGSTAVVQSDFGFLAFY